MALDVLAQIDIARPPESVAAYEFAAARGVKTAKPPASRQPASCTAASPIWSRSVLHWTTGRTSTC